MIDNQFVFGRILFMENSASRRTFKKRQRRCGGTAFKDYGNIVLVIFLTVMKEVVLNEGLD